MSAPINTASPAAAAHVIDSSILTVPKSSPIPLPIPSEVYTRATGDATTSTHVSTKNGACRPNDPRVTEVPLHVGENWQSTQGIAMAKAAYNHRSITTFDPGPLDESTQNRDRSKPGAKECRSGHVNKPNKSNVVDVIEPAMQTLHLVSKTSTEQVGFNTWEKFGWFCRTFLIGGLVCVLAAIGFLAFLWFGNGANYTWDIIATRN
jgi:hypothetical protein